MLGGQSGLEEACPLRVLETHTQALPYFKSLQPPGLCSHNSVPL